MINYRKIKWNLILGIPLMLFCIFWVLYGYYNRAKLEKRYKLTVGQTTHVSRATYKNNSRGISYEFILEGIKYQGEIGITNCDNYNLTDLSWLLVNRNFKIAYDSVNPSNNTIVISSNTAIKFNQKLTDTIMHFDSIVNCLKIYGNF